MSVAAHPAELRLKRGEDKRLRAGHLWVFSNEVDTAVTPLSAFRAGQQVRVVSDRGQPLGIGYVNPATLICARILARAGDAHGDAAVDRRLIAARLHAALVLRERLYPTPHYRCCYGESDLLPGLVLDRYGDVVVGQITTAGMEVLRPDIEAAIRDVLAPATLVWKNDSAARALEGLPETVTTAWGDAPDDIEATEHPAPGRSLRFLAPLAAGQKTGWFYDQAWNRARLARYLAPGARVLDVCSYAGGWAITAATQGAASVSCIDSSQRALDAVARNATAHGVDVELLRGDAFEVLASLASAGRRFDAVIVDPPAFIKRRKDIPAGQAAYRRLNQLALRVLAGDALLVSCSCSYHLEPQALLAAIQGAARHAGRFVQVLEAGGQSPDHPVHPAITETRYLKAYFCRVTGE